MKKKLLITDNNLGGILTSEPLIKNNFINKFVKYEYIDSSKKIKIVVKKSKWLIKETERVKKSKLAIGNYGNFLDYGRLDWYNDNSYVDSILILLLFPIFNNKISTFISKKFLNKQLSIDEIPVDKQNLFMCKQKTIAESIILLNDIYKSFDTLYNKLNNKDIINSFNFIEIFSKCDRELSKNYYYNNPIDNSINFLRKLLNIYNIHTTDYNIKNIYMSIDTPSYQFSESFSGIFEENVDEYIAGIKNYDFVESKTLENSVILKTITSEDLENIYSLGISDVLTEQEFKRKKINIKKYFYDKDIKKWYDKKNKLKNKLLKNKKKIFLSRFLNHKREIYPENFYYPFEDNKIIIEDGIYYVEDSKKIRYNIDELDIKNDKFTKINKIIEEYRIIDTEMIFFTLSRNNLENNFLNLKIIPDETINVKSKIVTLKGIIINYNNHYITFFKNSNLWYKYDNNYDPSKFSDYIELIGNYSNLLSYSLENTDYIILKKAIIVWYN